MSGSARPAKPALMALAAVSLAIAAATWLPPPAKADGELNIYNWSDYIGENTVANFEKEYNVKVRYDTYDGNETLEAKLRCRQHRIRHRLPLLRHSSRARSRPASIRSSTRSKLTNWKQPRPVRADQPGGLRSRQRLCRAVHVGHQRLHLQCRHDQGAHAGCAARQPADVVRSRGRLEVPGLRRQLAGFARGRVTRWPWPTWARIRPRRTPTTSSPRPKC